MWTSEYIDDKIVVTILDDTGSEADLKIEMIEAMKRPEGVFVRKMNSN